MKENTFIHSTGKTYTGTIFTPFGTKSPSEEIGLGATSNHVSAHRAPISSGGEGWTSKPDTGGTDVSRNDSPIGEPWILLLFAMLFGFWKAIHRKRALGILLLLLCTNCVQAGITALDISPACAGQRVTVNPTVSSVPDGMVYICWSAFYDAACENEIEDVAFRAASETGTNAVCFTAPNTTGTYYVKASVHTGRVCGGLMDSYYTYPFIVYPADADIVLKRDDQGSGSRIDIREGEARQAYGAMRFSRSALNNEGLSAYERYNYFVSFPFDVQVADIYGIGDVGTHWRIFYYDGKGRAEEGFFAERTDNWVMIDDTDSILHAGQGYLLQLNAIQMAEDNEEVWSNDADIATLYFPALSKISAVTIANETIPALSEAYQCTIDLSSTLGSEADRRAKDSYWRCIGVPSFDTPAGISGLPYLYEWDMSDNSLKVVSSSDYTFEPTHAYLVQNGGEIIWTDVVKPVNAIVAQLREDSYKEFRLELLHNGETADQTYVRLTDNEQVTADFDFGNDLSKEMNTGRPNIYTKAGYERLAANCLPDSGTTVTIPIGVQIFTDGGYTFAMPDRNQDRTVKLVDSQTNTCTSLSSETNYTVALTEGTYEERFFLEISKSTNTPTDVNHTISDHSTDHSTDKILKNGRLYLIRNHQIYDLLGRRID